MEMFPFIRLSLCAALMIRVVSLPGPYGMTLGDHGRSPISP